MKNLLTILCLFFLCSSPILAQDKSQPDLKNAQKPDIYIDGKKYDYAIFNLLDQDKIESVSVVKGEKALKNYNAPYGVVLIVTKKLPEDIIIVEEDKIEIRGGDIDPLFIIDGKVSDKATLSKLKPDDIESIEVFKDEKAIELYNAPFGAIVVKTKK